MDVLRKTYFYKKMMFEFDASCKIIFMHLKIVLTCNFQSVKIAMKDKLYLSFVNSSTNFTEDFQTDIILTCKEKQLYNETNLVNYILLQKNILYYSKLYFTMFHFAQFFFHIFFCHFNQSWHKASLGDKDSNLFK